MTERNTNSENSFEDKDQPKIKDLNGSEQLEIDECDECEDQNRR